MIPLDGLSFIKTVVISHRHINKQVLDQKKKKKKKSEIIVIGVAANMLLEKYIPWNST